jgi:hypothetical protein
MKKIYLLSHFLAYQTLSAQGWVSQFSSTTADLYIGAAVISLPNFCWWQRRHIAAFHRWGKYMVAGNNQSAFFFRVANRLILFMKPFFSKLLFFRIFSMCSCKALLLTAVTASSALCAHTQSYYPGGLGNSNLIVWLNTGNSASITQSAGAVSLWSDLSGNAYNFSQGTASRRPAYTAAGGPSGRPALSFNAASINYLSRNNISGAISFAGGVSSFAAASFNASTNGKGFERIYDFGNGTASENIWLGRQGTGANIGYETRSGGAIAQTYATSNVLVNGTNNIYETVEQGGTAGTLSAVAFYKAGTVQASSGTFGSFSYVPNSITRTLDYIGKSNWAADDYFSGTMSEILLYNTAMNTTQRVILENYLWAAWGLPVSITRYTPPVANTYYSNLVGIGYTSAADNFLADVGGSTDGLGFSSGTGASDFLNTAGYVTAAHNRQTNTINSGVSIAGIGSNLDVWNRSWNVQQTGGNSSGLITLNFNFSDYNGTAPNSTYSYGLLYNATDGSFSTGTNKLIQFSSLSIVGNIAAFTVYAAKLPAGYYTIVWSTSTILPVSLTSFTATRQANTGLLQWDVSNCCTGNSFNVQRAADATRFTTLANVAATANSAASNRYSFTDYSPLPGNNYYRLEMASIDGTITYSPVCFIDFLQQRASAMTIYPSPFTGVLHIGGATAGGNIIIRIINAAGQVVKTIQQPASGIINIRVADLAKGLYIVEINTSRAVYIQKIIKQ